MTNSQIKNLTHYKQTYKYDQLYYQCSSIQYTHVSYFCLIFPLSNLFFVLFFFLNQYIDTIAPLYSGFPHLHNIVHSNVSGIAHLHNIVHFNVSGIAHLHNIVH